ncbi:hypothetical protein Poli38472_003545 [Pythium oligandrum]|uniref:Uncharacterized protein n=1 Tax=Pythium oligandrum TaxID=41045 RepID=A0A8K1C7A2_PYTOL|nr:hypothetical protein Poli38472_003545 [Pythium oligandrum]|eukprot:TMW57620.1 hypothetical protein Poli38472_003545 [Pythium oligandrum]
MHARQASYDPYVAILSELKQLREAMQCMRTAVDAIVPAVVDAVVSAVENQGQTILMSRSELQHSIQDAIEGLKARPTVSVDCDIDAVFTPIGSTCGLPMNGASMGMSSASSSMHVIQEESTSRTMPPNAVPMASMASMSHTSDVTSSGQRYLWGNAWHDVPEDFEIPRSSLPEIWRLWCRGDPVKGYKPLRQLETSDVPTKNTRKRLSDLRFLMRHIESLLIKLNVWRESPSEEEANQMLRAAFDKLPLADVAANGRKRQPDDIKWHSAVSIMRNAVSNKKARITE